MGCYVINNYVVLFYRGDKEMSLSERDYQYYGCRIKNYVLDEEKKTLVLYCDYLERSYVMLPILEVCAYDSLEFLVNHIINHVVCSYDIETDSKLFEIHFDHLYETTKIWAKTMLPISHLTDSTLINNFYCN